MSYGYNSNQQNPNQGYQNQGGYQQQNQNQGYQNQGYQNQQQNNPQQGGNQRALPTVGDHLGRFVGVASLGEQEDRFNPGRTKSDLCWTFQLGEINPQSKNQKPFFVKQMTGMSPGKPASANEPARTFKMGELIRKIAECSETNIDFSTPEAVFANIGYIHRLLGTVMHIKIGRTGPSQWGPGGNLKILEISHPNRGQYAFPEPGPAERMYAFMLIGGLDPSHTPNGSTQLTSPEDWASMPQWIKKQLMDSPDAFKWSLRDNPIYPFEEYSGSGFGGPSGGGGQPQGNGYQQPQGGYNQPAQNGYNQPQGGGQPQGQGPQNQGYNQGNQGGYNAQGQGQMSYGAANNPQGGGQAGGNQAGQANPNNGGANAVGGADWEDDIPF